MAQYPFVVNPGADLIPTDPTLLDPTLQTPTPQGALPDLPFVDYSGGVSLSGDTPAAAPVTPGADTSLPDNSLPFVPSAAQSTNGQPSTMQLGPGQTWLGNTGADTGMPSTMKLAPGQKWLGAATPSSQMPQAVKTNPVGQAPPANFGNDWGGNVLKAEQNLPEWARAAVHGAQSQALPFGGMLAGMEAGSLVGLAGGPVGVVIGGLVGGFIGGWVGSQAQNAIGPNVVSKQTMDALNTQTQYEQKNDTLAYGIGQAIPQFLAFRPSPAALKGTWQLMGRIAVAPSVGAKVALIRGADSDVKNQLFMIALGGAQQGYQAQQEVAAGNFNPALFAINLASATLLSQPGKLLQAVSPMYRMQVSEQLKTATEYVNSGVAQGLQDISAMAGGTPEGKMLTEAAQRQYDKISPLIAARKPLEAQQAVVEFQKLHQELVNRYAGVNPTEEAPRINQQGPVSFDRLNQMTRGEAPVPPPAPVRPFEDFNRIVSGQGPRVVDVRTQTPSNRPITPGAWWRHPNDQWEKYPPPEPNDPQVAAELRMINEKVNSGEWSPEQADQYAHANSLPDWYTPANGMTHPYQGEPPAPVSLQDQQFTRGLPGVDPNMQQGIGDAAGKLGLQPEPMAANGLDPAKFNAAVDRLRPSDENQPPEGWNLAQNAEEERAKTEAYTKGIVNKLIPSTMAGIEAREAQRITDKVEHFGPEPTKEATPQGVVAGIRDAVEKSPAASAAYEALSPIGDVHVVGGAVRNMILGKPIKDLDLTFSGSEDELVNALSKIGDAQFQKTGENFPVYRLNVGDDQVEIALHRTENPENQNAFASGKDIPIADDLGRRDFTFNSMATNIKTGDLVDPHNGFKNAQSKTLALVNPLAFAGDPVRMLRALRFIGDGFHPTKTLMESMKENAALLQNVPPERIQTELDRVFSSDKPGKALEAMKESTLLDHIFPEHLKTIGFDQRSTHHNQLLWDHIMGVVNKTAELNPDPDVRMAAFLHDISKPDTQVERPGTGGKMSYIGHEDKGAEVAHRVLTGLKYSNDRVARIEFLVKNHMFAQEHVMAHPAGFIHDMSKDLMGVPVDERQAIVDQRIKDLFDIREADQSNHPVNKADIKGMQKALDSIGQKPIGRPASNIDGNDLLDLGLTPGPQFGKILKQLDHEVLYENLPNEPETLLARAKELITQPLQARKSTPQADDQWMFNGKPFTAKDIIAAGGTPVPTADILDGFIMPDGQAFSMVGAPGESRYRPDTHGQFVMRLANRLGLRLQATGSPAVGDLLKSTNMVRVRNESAQAFEVYKLNPENLANIETVVRAKAYDRHVRDYLNQVNETSTGKEWQFDGQDYLDNGEKLPLNSRGGRGFMARKSVPYDEDPWPATRQAILAYGGIGPSKDWPKDMIPGDLYRSDGKAPDMVATEATIGRADIPPWGDNKSDSDMMSYLHRAWEQHVKYQQGGGAFTPDRPVADNSGHVNQLPRAIGVKGPNPAVRDVAAQYAIRAGIRPPTETPPVTVNPEKAKRLASFYEKAQSDPTNPQVQASYQAFNAETEAQWQAAVQAGYHFEAWDHAGQPYKNSAEMRADVRDNHHLYYFKTSEGSSPHDLTTETQNDKFRAVHDLFGHAMNGNEFGPNGEENAWAEHAKMYTPLAQKAMTTETRAQNSVVNFGEHGEANRANPAKTIFPDQKAILPPSEFLPGQPMRFTHWSAKAREFIDPEHQGDSGTSSEIAHSGPNTNKAARFASYYEEGRSPERFFGPGTPFPVKHTVTGDFKILDMNTTEGRALQSEVARKNIYGVRVPHELDDALQAAGYDGYKYGDQGTTRMFGRQAVSHVNDLPVTPQEGQTDFTARLGPGQEIQRTPGEKNGLQQESTSPTETGSEASGAGQERIPGQGFNASKVGGQDLAQAVNQTSDFGTPDRTTEGQATNDLGGSVEGQLGSAESGAIPPPSTGAGDVRTYSGDEARTAGATVHTPRPGVDATGRPVAIGSALDSATRTASDGRVTTAPDFTPESFANRNREAAQLGTTASDKAAQGGDARWRSSSDVEATFVPAAHAKATEFGVNVTDPDKPNYVGDVPFRGGIRLSPLEHQENVRLANKPNNDGNVGKTPLRKDLLVIPDDPALVPEVVNSPAKWKTQESFNKLVDLIRGHVKGDPNLGYLPSKITDDAGRVALVLKGWDKRFFYDNARDFPTSGNISFAGLSDGARAKWAAFQPIFGDGASVIINGRNTIVHFARMESGVFRNRDTGEEFDPQIFTDLVNAGIIKQYGKNGMSLDNLVQAAKGFLSRTLKIGDYAGAMNGEARAPVDMWEARINYGVDSTPTTKMYEYGFGRNNFITRMFNAHDPSILPSHIQSAEWFGYQSLVSERVVALKQAALATGDPELIKLAQGMRANLESRDLSEVFREYFGLTNNAKPPSFAIDKILSNPKYREALLEISQNFTRRYLKGSIGKSTKKGGFNDVLDVQQGGLMHDVDGLLQKNPAMRTALAKYYKEYFVDSQTLRGGQGAARQSLDRNIGPVMERIMEAAYAHQYPEGIAKLGKQADDLIGLVRISDADTQAHSAKYIVKNKVGWRDRRENLGDSLVQPLADLHDLFGLPRGLAGVKVTYDATYRGGYIAQYDPGEPNLIEVNARHMTYLSVIREDLAGYLTSAITKPQFKDLKGEGLAKVKRVIEDYRTGDEASVQRVILAHELGHLIQDRIYGKGALNFSDFTPDHMMLQSAVSILEHMTPKYMSLLVKEGLGNEMEALMQAHSSSINEYLGGKKEAEVQGKVMPLNEAVTAILEHQAHQWSIFNKIKHADYSWATPETYRRNIYDPETAKASYNELGKIYQKAIKGLDDSLAIEAESQLSGRGPNPAIDKELPSADETGAGPAAYAKLSEADALHPDTSGWTDPQAPDQELARQLTTGERASTLKVAADNLRMRMADPEYKPTYGDRQNLADLTTQANAVPTPPLAIDPWMARTTAQAVERIQRLPGEGDRGFAERLVKASGAYSNLDHALGVASAARDGGFVPVMLGNKIGFKIDGKFYAGVPGDHVTDWAPGYHDAVHSVLDGVPDGAMIGEPSSSGVGAISGEQLRTSLADEFNFPRVASSAREGAVSITAKTGEEIPVPSLQPHHFLLAKNADMPSSKLSAGSAANMAKAHFENAAQGIKLTEELTDKGLFDPDVIEEAFQAEQAAAGGEGGGGDEPPLPPQGGSGDIGGGGKPPKGQSDEEKEADRKKAEILRSADVLRDYMTALKNSLTLDDPAHQTITSGINDLIVQAMKTFSPTERFKDARTYAVDATYAMKSLANQYDRVGNAIVKRLTTLEVKSPGANDRIRKVQYAKTPEERDSLLKGMSDEEKLLASHLHEYWTMMGDVLQRSGMTKSAVENYFPLMVDKGGKLMGDRGVDTSKYSQKTVHAIARMKNEDGTYRHETPEDLQDYIDSLTDKKTKEPLDLGWKVRTNVGEVFKIQGIGVTKAMTAKHAIDQLITSEIKVGKEKGEMAPPILTPERMRKNEIASANIADYVQASKMIGKWKSALVHGYWKGDHRVEEDYWVHKDLANVMEREATWAEMPKDVATTTAKTIAHYNQLFKKYQFFLTPMHEWSLLGNLTAHAGLNPWKVKGILNNGDRIVNDPAASDIYSLLTRAGGADEFTGALGIEGHIPGYQWYHDLIWKKTMYNGTYGLGHKIMQEHLASRAARGIEITPEERFDAAKVGMKAAKQAMGSMTNIDMSNNWRLWGNVLFLANRWTTGQLRTIGEATGFKRLSNIGGGVSLEGHTAESTAAMQARSMQMSQRLLTGGLIRLAIVGTALSTGVSALLNSGVPSTPFDNFQKDPARTFDIYAGRDANGKDQWFRMPFYLFQREMVDLVMSAVKANNEGKDFIDTKNLGDSAALAPFIHFAGKIDPVTKASLEAISGQELNGWMRGYSSSQIDSDPQIQNLNQSLQLLGFGDGGSLENRTLNAIRSLWPASGFPRKLDAPTADYGSIAGALGLGIGPLSMTDPNGRLGSATNIGLGLLGSGQLAGISNKMGPGGVVQPAWMTANYYKKQDQVGQQILKIASTLGTGTQQEELDKFQQMEDLRVSVGLTPASLTNLILHGNSQPVGASGVLAEGAAPKKPENAVKAPTSISGVPLTPDQETAYNSVLFQRQMQSLEQVMADPTWKTMDATERSNAMSSLKAFADRITNEQFGIAIGIKKESQITSTQASSMIAEFGMIKRATQSGLVQSSIYTAADPATQKIMMTDRQSSVENAVWEKYFGTTALKGASDATLTTYVNLASGLKDETRALVEKLPSYSRSNDPYAKKQMLDMSLAFADSLVTQAAAGKSPSGFSSPLTQDQLTVAVRNGVVLQDAALKNLHQSFIYQEANQADQLALDRKYASLAHGVALSDARMGVQETFGQGVNFNSILNTSLAADEGYGMLIEQFFGTGGKLVLAEREKELADLKARFRQENALRPADLTKYDTLINKWYRQQNPDYASFLYYRALWEKNDPVGQAYVAMSQSNYGFESLNPLGLPAQ